MDAVASFESFAERYKNYGRTAATIFAILFVVLLFWKFFTYPDPPPGQDGTLVSFGEPNIGQGNERAADTAPPIETAEPEPEPEPVEEVEPESEPEEVEPKVEPKKEKAEPDNKKVLEAEASKERVLKEKKRREEKKKREEEAAEESKKKAERDKKRKAEREAKRKADEAKRKAEEEAKRKAAAEAARKAKEEADKNKMGDLFGGSGSGQGNTGTPGNQGSQDGDPNSNNLEGLGTGRVGGGLSNRGGKGPKLSDRSQKNGKVIVKVCVDSKGKVISASPTQNGSSIWDAALNRKIKANAMKWTFANGELDKQCGTITYTFKLQ